MIITTGRDEPIYGHSDLEKHHRHASGTVALPGTCLHGHRRVRTLRLVATELQIMMRPITGSHGLLRLYASRVVETASLMCDRTRRVITALNSTQASMPPSIFHITEHQWRKQV